MSVLIACGYCGSLFLPHDGEGFCPVCLPGYIRLQEKCACHIDPAASVAGALDRLRRYTLATGTCKTPLDEE